MSLPWPREIRAGLCPDRIVLGGAVHPAADPVAELGLRAGTAKFPARVTVVLSNHLVKYALLPWSAALKSERDWVAYARHGFLSTYGDSCAAWRIQVSPEARGEARLASAVDGGIIDALRAIPAVASIQPYLMAAFNTLRKAFSAQPAWLVVQEPGRLTLALAAGHAWKTVRSRKAHGDWRNVLCDLLERESAAGKFDCRRVLVWSEEEAPAELGGYRITDMTPRRAAPRSHAMVH